MNLEPPSEHHVLVFFVAVLVLFVTARLLGNVMQRLGQPAVIGELGAGVVLGPSLLGQFAPRLTTWLFPEDEVQTAMLFTVGWLGVTFLLVSTGAETDLGLIRRLGRAAVVVSVTSLLVPLVLGFVTGLGMPESLMGEPDHRKVFALFVAAALGISSLPVMAKILGEMQLLRRDFAQLTLAAGMVNDVVGWVLLGAVAGVAQAGQLEIGTVLATVVGVAAFFVVAFTLGQFALDRLLRGVRKSGNDGVSGLAAVMVVVIGLGAVTQWLGVEAVLGAFVGGILFGRSKYADHAVLGTLETATFSFFAPVFFATAGLRVDLSVLAEGEVALWTVVVVLVASVAKFGGSFVGARLASLGAREASALSIGLNARGALEIVIATLGLSLGVLNDRSYTAIVVMAIVTSVLAPPLLRLVLRGWQGTEDEQARLEEEETLRTNSVVRPQRILLPSEAGPSSIMAAQIVDLVWPEGVDATVLTVSKDPVALRPVVDSFGHRAVDVKRVRSADVARAVVEEAKLGYGAIAVGAPSLARDHLLSPLVDRLVDDHAVPLVVVRRGADIEGHLPWAYGRAVVPVTGTLSARAAQEVAFGLSRRIGTEVLLTHVVEPAVALTAASAGQNPRPGRAPEAIADDLLSEAEQLGSRSDARTGRVVHTASSVGRGICDVARRTASDLVVMGATKRGTDRLFLGHTVEQVLEGCDCTVVVVLTPPQHRPAS